MNQTALDNFSTTEYSCPWDGCDRDFDSKRGVKIHHKSVHGESIAGPDTVVDCDWCESPIQRYESNINDGRGNFCDKDCKNEWQRVHQAGENHNQYGRVEVECEWCGQPKMVAQCRTETRDYHFCDDGCKGEYISANITGRDHPRYSQVTVDCDWCGESKRIHPSKLERYDHHFCPAPEGSVASDCYRKWRAEMSTGSNNPRWKPGRSRKFYRAVRRALGPRSWGWIKREFWEKEPSACAMPGCDGNVDRYDNSPSVHHIIPVLLGGVNDWNNLLPLCSGCHRGVEHYTQYQLSNYIPEVLVDYGPGELPEGRLPSREFQKICAAVATADYICERVCQGTD